MKYLSQFVVCYNEIANNQKIRSQLLVVMATALWVAKGYAVDGLL